jgi:hypothetical protein
MSLYSFTLLIYIECDNLVFASNGLHGKSGEVMPIKTRQFHISISIDDYLEAIGTGQAPYQIGVIELVFRHMGPGAMNASRGDK